MQFQLSCPHCGVQATDTMNYERIIMLSPTVALAAYKCPNCHMRITFSGKIPEDVRKEVTKTIEDAGYAIPSQRFPQFMMRPVENNACRGNCGASCNPQSANAAGAEVSEQDLEEFKMQLDSIKTVDDMLFEIDSSDEA